MNMFNLHPAVRGVIVPAVVFTLLALGPLATSPKAEVLNPNSVPISAAEWAEKSPDAVAVTVRDALTNSDNSYVVAGAVNSSSAPYLSLLGSDGAGSIWWPSSNGENAEIKLQIRNASGSVTGECTVSSRKGTDGKYETAC